MPELTFIDGQVNGNKGQDWDEEWSVLSFPPCSSKRLKIHLSRTSVVAWSSFSASFWWLHPNSSLKVTQETLTKHVAMIGSKRINFLSWRKLFKENYYKPLFLQPPPEKTCQGDPWHVWRWWEPRRWRGRNYLCEWFESSLQHSPPSPQQEAALVQVQLEKRARLAHAIIIEMIFIAEWENDAPHVLTRKIFLEK